MKNYLFFLILLPFTAWTQHNISGQVLSRTDKQPIVGASVFINNTTKGTMTDAKGKFTLSQVNGNTVELVVSIIGYDKLLMKLELPLKQPLTLYLSEKAQQLKEIKVSPYEKDGWAKWGKLFEESFIGTTDNAESVKLQNWKDVRFRFHKSENKLEAVALKPLKIQNKALGYELEYHLEIFEIDFKNKTNIYAGYPLFKETQKLSKRQIRNRETAYHGSQMKFVRSLYHNTLQEDGYLVRKMIEKENKEKARIKALYEKYTFYELSENGTKIALNTPQLPKDVYTEDSLKYFRKVMQEPNSSMHVRKDTLRQDEIVITKPDGRKVVDFSDYLYIVNTQHKESQKFIEYIRIQRNVGPQTYIWLMIDDENEIEIYSNGNFDPPLALMSGEYWNWSNKIADMLPLDYTKKER